MWGLLNGAGQYQPKVLLDSTGANISSFGEDSRASSTPSYRAGKILKIILTAPSSDTLPRLARRPVPNASNLREVAEGVIPWVTTALVGRLGKALLAIPDGSHITVKPDGH